LPVRSQVSKVQAVSCAWPSHEIGAGTSEVRRMLIGRELFEETA
jgi:hypothetical protein